MKEKLFGLKCTFTCRHWRILEPCFGTLHRGAAQPMASLAVAYDASGSHQEALGCAALRDLQTLRQFGRWRDADCHCQP